MFLCYFITYIIATKEQNLKGKAVSVLIKHNTTKKIEDLEQPLHSISTFKSD